MQGLTQKPLRQVSMPHWLEAVQAREPGGTLRQVPEAQNFPVLHWELLVQVVAVVGWHSPLVQLQLEEQSSLPGQ